MTLNLLSFCFVFCFLGGFFVTCFLYVALALADLKLTESHLFLPLPSARMKGLLYYTWIPKSIPPKARIPEARIWAYTIIIVVDEMTLSLVNLHSKSKTGQSVMVHRAVARAKCENIMIMQNLRQQPNPT